MSEIVTGCIQPIQFKDLRAMKSKDLIRAEPDQDNPITSAIMSRLPELTYSHLEALRQYLMTHSPKLSPTKARVVDEWLKLVNDEMIRRDEARKPIIGDLMSGKITLLQFLSRGEIK